MAETLRSVGIDVGTTSTQMILSELTIENRASSFLVPELVISDRKILYKSPIYLTPLLGEDRIDGEGVRKIVEQEYEKAGITRDCVDTGAIIITGETSRKENAKVVLEALSALAGDFVVATAGPDLESRLAAKGSGAQAYSRQTGKTLLHMDIGGGTSNLCLLKNGEILDTGCLNVGGRLLHYDENQRICWISPALIPLTDLKPGEKLEEEQALELVRKLAKLLEMAAGLTPTEPLLSSFVTREGKLLEPGLLREKPMLSFSGGVADCIEELRPWRQFGDLGPLLGKAIRESRLCSGDYRLEGETIRATVIGAGCHSTQLSGSTVFYQNMDFPLKNLPVVRMDLQKPQQFPEEGPFVLALSGKAPDSYEELCHQADCLAEWNLREPLILAFPQDMAKALGQALALRLGKQARILSMDRIHLEKGSFLDVGSPVGEAIPVVVKTLILEKGE